MEPYYMWRDSYRVRGFEGVSRGFAGFCGGMGRTRGVHGLPGRQRYIGPTGYPVTYEGHILLMNSHGPTRGSPMTDMGPSDL